MALFGHCIEPTSACSLEAYRAQRAEPGPLGPGERAIRVFSPYIAICGARSRDGSTSSKNRARGKVYSGLA